MATHTPACAGRGGPAFRRIAPDEYVGGKERWGMNVTHRPTGILFLSEPSHAARARLEDVAPTVLAALGVPGPAMDGDSLLGRSESPETLGGQPGARPEPRVYSESEERAIEERLRNLGYFE